MTGESAEQPENGGGANAGTTIDTSMPNDARRQAYQAPHTIARFTAVAMVLATLGFIWLVLSLDGANLTAERSLARDSVLLMIDREPFDLAPDAPVTFSGVSGAELVIPAADLAKDPRLETPQRHQLAAHLRAGLPASARFTDLSGITHTREVRPRHARLGDFDGSDWMGLASALLGALFGLAVWASRPQLPAALAYGIVGGLLLASALTHRMYLKFGLLTPPELATTTSVLNGAVLHAFGLAFVFVFLLFPKALLTPRTAVTAAVASGIAALSVVALGQFVDARISYYTQMVEYLALLALVCIQFWIGRKATILRPSLIILLATILLGIALYALTVLLPESGLVKVTLGEDAAFPLFVLIYCGIGIAIVRTSLLSLDGWVRNIVLSVAFLAAILLVDIALLTFVTRQQDVALGLAFAGAALVYFPLREWLARRQERRRLAVVQHALSRAADLVFAANDQQRSESWRAAVEASFQPLAIETDPAPVKVPAIGQNGTILRLPSLGGAPALLCRHADGGRRPFAAGDLDTAAALIRMTERLIATRDAYLAGVTEERHRIARDLHDDVSGRLMISLHRSDTDGMRQDVREAMADIRTIVTGLAGKPRELADLMADLREESRSRCEAAGFSLDWPPDETETGCPLDYAVYRHLLALFRESVSNAIRHSGGDRVTIRTTLSHGRLSAQISDNGTGKQEDTLQRSDGGHGLDNCRLRARSLNGHFAFEQTQTGSEARFDIDLSATPAATDPGH
jgi:signal transduction histidine kinase